MLLTLFPRLRREGDANATIHDKSLSRESLFLTTWPPPPAPVTAKDVERELMRAWNARPPYDPHTTDVLRWPVRFIVAKHHIDALFDRRMAVKSGLPVMQWLKAFGRVYATHQRAWKQACTVIATAITAHRLAQA